MQILLRICIEEHLLEQRNATIKNCVPHHDEPTGVCFRLLADPLLTLAPCGMGRFVERCPGCHRRNLIGGPLTSNVEGLLPRAFLVSSRTRFAISMRSRQSGSMLGRGGDSTGSGLSESSCRLVGTVRGLGNIGLPSYSGPTRLPGRTMRCSAWCDQATATCDTEPGPAGSGLSPETAAANKPGSRG